MFQISPRRVREGISRLNGYTTSIKNRPIEYKQKTHERPTTRNKEENKKKSVKDEIKVITGGKDFNTAVKFGKQISDS